MQSTTNYNLKKPENIDLYNVQDMNDNMDAIDTALKSLDTGKATKASVDNILSGATKVPKASTADNATSLGGETSSAWQTKVDNIQTTSGNTSFTTAGWYRVAEYTGSGVNIHVLKGNQGDTCELEIKQSYQSTGQSLVRLLFTNAYSKPQFDLLSSTTHTTQAITKVRHTYSESEGKAWLEAYYALSTPNPVKFFVNDGMSANSNFVWKAIKTPTVTEEIVDGVTVTTTFDISKDARPATNLDVVNAVTNDTYAKKIGASSTSTEDPNTTELPRIRVKHANCPTTSGTYIIDTIYTDGTNEVTEKFQIAQGAGGLAYLGFRAKAYNGTWTKWEEVATTADLANYLSKTTGGTVNVSSYDSFSINRTAESDTAVSGIIFKLNGTKIGGIGYSGGELVKYNHSGGSPRQILDASNYSSYALPKTGGDINGNVFVTGNISATTTEAIARNISLKNSLRRVYQELNVSGDYSLYDSTNSKHIIRSTADGTTTFNGSSYAVQGLQGGSDADRHVWFSDNNNEERRNYNDNFTYNPSTKKLKINGKEVLTTAGGTVNGDISLTASDASARTFKLKNSMREVKEYVSASGTYYMQDVTNSGKGIIVSTPEGATTFHGTATGNLVANADINLNASDTTARTIRLNNSLRNITFNVASNGHAGIYDSNAGKWIVQSTADGTNTFYGTASGNLVFTSTNQQTVSAPFRTPFIIKSSYGDVDEVYLGFKHNDNWLGFFGFNAQSNPVYTDASNNTKELLHAGNSAKVVVSSTPLTAEGSVRVW